MCAYNCREKGGGVKKTNMLMTDEETETIAAPALSTVILQDQKSFGK